MLGPAGILAGLGLLAFALLGAGPWVAARRAGLFGLAANLVALRFVPEVITRFTSLPPAAGWTALLLLAAAQGIPWAVGGAVSALAVRRLRAPSFLAFATGVYVCALLPAVFPWTPAAGLAPWPVLIQSAEVLGEHGVTLVAALVAGLAAEAARARRATLAVVAGLVLATLAAEGAWRMHAVEAARASAPHVKVALLQPGFDAYARWDESRAGRMMERLTALTRSAEARSADLVVWPESAYPYTIAHATRRAPPGVRAVLQPGVRGPVLTGAYMSGPKGLGYNAAFLATSDGLISKPYDKRHLLWFGETVPGADTFPWLREVFARGTGLLPGDESVAFAVGPMTLAVLNCYEDTLAAAGREAMEVKPNLLVNVTNDAWFEGSLEGELHLMLARVRAVETRRDLVRAVNLGPTSHVDAAGRVVARYDAPLPGALDARPALLDGPPTAFTRFGDVPVIVVLILGLLKPHGRRLRRPEGRP